MAHGERANNLSNWRGRDYWSRRYGNDSCTASYRAQAHRDPQSHKRITRRVERRTGKQQQFE